MSLPANLNRIIIAVLVLIILVMVAGWYWISNQARRESFEIARQLDPDNAEMMHAYEYSQQGHLDKALYWMGKAVLVDPHNLDLGGWMVFLNDSLEDYGAAQEWSDWLDDRITKQSAPMAMQARHHYMTGNFELALQFSNRALKMNIPDRWGSDSVFMRIKRDEALANGNPAAGIEVFRERHPALFKAVPEISPANAVQAVDLAQLLKMASKPDQAAKLLNAVIEFYDQPWAATGVTLFPLAPVKAEALAIMGNEAAATTELRRIIDKGWRLDWRWETELNFNFNGIRETTEFKTMVNELATNMAEQRTRVYAMIDRGEIAPPPEPRALTPFSPFSQNSVAVLPFVTMSNGPDDDYFSDGLTEEIINALAQLPELLVTARTSAFHFKDQNLPVAEIANRLGVGHIVEGSVHRAGEQLRITAQLIRAEDGFHLWSETYDGRTQDTFDVQSDIAEKVATALNVVLDDDQRARMRQVGIRNVAAYTAYQKGLESHAKAHGVRIDIPFLREGNRHHEDAIALAPDFSDAYLNHADLFVHILMAQARGQLDGNITEADIQGAPAAMKHDYDRAIKHAKNSGQRLVAEHDRALLLGNWAGLASLSERALTAPGCELAIWAYLGESAFGQAELVRDAYRRRSACDPLFVHPRTHLADARLWLEQYTATTGPDDLYSLVLHAQQGNRNEANRLASLIDQRPFGYIVLMQAIYYCLCGAPFDLEAAPIFSSMLNQSGWSWPPVKPIDFPLKDR